MKISDIMHPDYFAMVSDWEKFRATFAAGHEFVDNYVLKFSSREEDTDFLNRKELSYTPAHAKSAIEDIKNSIYQRLSDIRRVGGPASYQSVLNGMNSGVDKMGNSMTGYIGHIILPELLTMAKVGVFVDRNPIPDGARKNQTTNNRPYLYMYAAEAIRSWQYDNDNNLVSLLLQDIIDSTDEATGLVIGTTEQYRLLKLTDAGVKVDIYNSNSEITESTVLNIAKIPFVIMELNHSLLVDAADYQVALANIASSDVNFILKANFPFFVEQYNPITDMTNVRSAGADATDDRGTAAAVKAANDKNIKIGVAQGRRYPQGTERPGFINPSSEPLKASMEKQQQMITEIRQLVNLAVTNIIPTRASAESKTEDAKGLEAGLSYIALELEHGERQIAELWSLYTQDSKPATVSYPKIYSLKSDSERRQEAKELLELNSKIPSKTFQKEVAKEAVIILIGSKISNEELIKIHDEIDAAEVVITDAEIISKDIENGLVSAELASQIRGYPKGQVAKAQIEKAERAKNILSAQQTASARGVSDVSSQDTGMPKLKNDDTKPDGNNQIRGKGK